MCNLNLRRYIAEVIKHTKTGDAFVKVEIKTHSWQDAYDEAKTRWGKELVLVRAATPWEIIEELVPELKENNQ